MNNINEKIFLKNLISLEDYNKYLEAIEYEDFYQIELIFKKYNLNMSVLV